MNLMSPAKSYAYPDVLSIVFASILWGTSGVTARVLYELSDFQPTVVAFYRLGVAAVALLIGLSSLREVRQTLRFSWTLLAMGIMQGLYQLCYFAAIPRVGVAVATLIALCVAPIIVAILAVIFLKERLETKTILALILAIVGTGLLVGGDASISFTTERVQGMLLALGSATGYAIFALCSRAASQRYHPLQSTSVAFSLGALLLLPFALPQFQIPITLTQTGLLLYLGLIPTALSYFLFLRGVRSVTATVASVVTLLEPLTATILATLLFNEQMSPLNITGGFLMVGALLLMSLVKSKQR
jgi:drug/metabolite transporter, DME family